MPVFTSNAAGLAQHWVFPVNAATAATVEIWGGGGGGGTANNTTNSGGGGGGGAYTRLAATLTPGTNYEYDLGGGGAGAAANNTNGTAGTLTGWNNNQITAPGGGAGLRGRNAGNAAGGANNNTNATASYAGGAGASGGGLSTGGGGGGGAGGNANGTAATTITGAAGGGTGGGASNSANGTGYNQTGSGGGAGGAGGAANGVGVAAGNPAGGGGGSGSNNSGVKTGGAGANGLITVTYTLAYLTVNVADTSATSEPLVRGNASALNISVSDTSATHEAIPSQTTVAQVALTPIAAPPTQTGLQIVVHAYTAAAATDTIVQCDLYMGATKITSSTLKTGALTTSVAPYTLNILDADAANITTWSTLSIMFSGFSPTGDASTVRIAQMWLVVPAWTAPPGLVHHRTPRVGLGLAPSRGSF
jgi:glycine rich protein